MTLILALIALTSGFLWYRRRERRYIWPLAISLLLILIDEVAPPFWVPPYGKDSNSSRYLTYLLIAGASLAAWIRWRQVFFCLPFLVSLSLYLEDEAYPFSWFPMYGDPDESENYFYLADLGAEAADSAEDRSGPPLEAEGVPIGVRTHTGLTAPKLKKMYRSWAEERADDLGKKDRRALSPEERAEVGTELIQYYRQQAERRGSPLPSEVALMEVWIRYEPGGGFAETAEAVAVHRLEASPSNKEEEAADSSPSEQLVAPR